MKNIRTYVRLVSLIMGSAFFLNAQVCASAQEGSEEESQSGLKKQSQSSSSDERALSTFLSPTSSTESGSEVSEEENLDELPGAMEETNGLSRRLLEKVYPNWQQQKQIKIADNIEAIGPFCFFSVDISSQESIKNFLKNWSDVHLGFKQYTSLKENLNTLLQYLMDKKILQVREETVLNCFKEKIPIEIRRFTHYGSLPKIVFSKTAKLKKIGQGAFAGYLLANVTNLPAEQIEEIESCAFLRGSFKTSWLFSASVPNFENIKKIGQLAFAYSDIETIKIGQGIEEIGGKAFFRSQLKQCAIESSNQGIRSSLTIEKLAFSETPLSSFILPGHTIRLGDGVFQNCEQLKTCGLNEGLLEIGKNCFHQCYLLEGNVKQAFFIPASVQKIGDLAFFECKNLQKFSVQENSRLEEIGKRCFEKTPGCFPLNSSEFFPNLKKIGDRAFYRHQNLEQIQLPKTVISLGNEVFQNCMNLQLFNCEEDGQLQTVGNSCFQGCPKLMAADFPLSLTRLGKSTFSGCFSLTTCFIPPEAKLECVPQSCFQGTALNRMILPTTVQGIKESAFQDCKKLSSVVLSSNIQLLEPNVFSGCSALSTVAFDPSSVLSAIPEGCFRGTAVRNIEIPGSVRDLARGSFEDCQQLKTVDVSACQNLNIEPDAFGFSGQIAPPDEPLMVILTNRVQTGLQRLENQSESFRKIKFFCVSEKAE